MRIPKIYVPASWRNTTPFDPAERCIGIGLDLPDGTVLRVRLDHASAAHLSETLDKYLPRGSFCQRWGIHSLNSSGCPTSDVSPHDAENVCPPTKSSSAAVGVE